ncbi:MAG: baseplate J/gp47 family protein [Lachnospiraceae bacterium]
MRQNEIDRRTKEDIIAYVKEISGQYTPEWRMNEENPDFGTALVYLYADMFADTIKKFNYSLERNRIAFFNELSASLLPAIPAKGFITFGLPPQMESGTQVPRHTQLLANKVDDDGMNLIFETMDDIFATPAKLTDMYVSNGTQDTIHQIYSTEEEALPITPFFLYDKCGENLQKHEFIIYHPYVFYIKGAGQIKITLVPSETNEISDAIMNAFTDPKNVVFSYLTDIGFVPFTNVKCENNTLILNKKSQSKAFWKQEESNYFQIKCEIKEVHIFENLELQNIMLGTKAHKISPEVIISGDSEQDKSEFFPFGESPSIYDEVYFSSNEVFQKKDARISIQFDLDFLKIPIDMDETEITIDWKVIMKKKDFKLDKEYDITIDQVTWEYYNGLGWSRLFPGPEYEDIFSTANGMKGQRKRMEFICPENIEKALVQADESYCIRAKILKIKNAYKINGFYITPLISEVKLSYDYTGHEQSPKLLEMFHNMQVKQYNDIDLNNSREFPLVETLEGNNFIWYLGFDRAPVDGPIKMLCNLYDTAKHKMPELVWEYYTLQGWKNMNVIDETENFRKTGLVTWIGNHDFIEKNIFRKTRYWIRIQDIENTYGMYHTRFIPRIDDICLNTTKIIHLQNKEGELLFVEQPTEFLTLSLMNTKVCWIQVWVNETNNLSLSEIDKLTENKRLDIVYSDNGVIESIWVKWEEVSDFSLSNGKSRHYLIDRNEGVLHFSDGIHGAIPPKGQQETIKVNYTFGGGEEGNLEINQIQMLNASVGFISTVTNPTKTYGGCDVENIYDSFKRNAETLTHRNRCVTRTDYEEISKAACRNIVKVKCFSGKNQDGEEEKGAITLVVLPNDYQSCNNSFEDIQEKLFAYLPKCMDSNIVGLGKLYVTKPHFLEIRIRAEIVVKDFNDVFGIKEDLNDALERFLDPISGNFNEMGWGIGKIPTHNQIMSIMKGIKGIEFIGNTFIDHYVDGRFGLMEVSIDKINTVYMLPKSGKHDLIFSVKKA